MRRWFLPLLILGAVVWAWNHWSSAPPTALPPVVWTPAPFRGPQAALEPGSAARLDAVLDTPSLVPPLENLSASAPDPRVVVVPSPRWDRRMAIYIGWRAPVPDAAAMTPSAAALWGARWFVHTGTTKSVGGVRWAEYRREDAR